MTEQIAFLSNALEIECCAKSEHPSCAFRAALHYFLDHQITASYLKLSIKLNHQRKIRNCYVAALSFFFPHDS